MRIYRRVGARLGRTAVIFMASVGSWWTQVPIECVGSAWLSLVVYETLTDRVWAWGIVLALLCHEAGHMLAARLVGVRTSMPIFVPFLGAVISLRSQVRRGRGEAAIALGGPALGALTSGLWLILYAWTQAREYLLWAHLGAVFNLFNLVPCYPLDGGRIAECVSRYAWCVGAVLMIGCGQWWGQPLLYLFAIGAVWRYRRAGDVCVFCGEHRAWIAGCYLLLCLLVGWLTVMSRREMWM